MLGVRATQQDKCEVGVDYSADPDSDEIFRHARDFIIPTENTSVFSLRDFSSPRTPTGDDFVIH
jgi:hypothetical protein